MARDLEGRLQSIRGIGPTLARRILAGLGIEDIETLRMAVESGRVEEIGGVGPEMARRLREGLATDPAEIEPPVDVLLDVDEQYRVQAAAGELPVIAPKKNNPAGEAWLPLLHTEREGRHFTALFSNTSRAHELGKTDDWVVVYEDVPDQGWQWTVVTFWKGDLQGKRVVRGREEECRQYYSEET